MNLLIFNICKFSFVFLCFSLQDLDTTIEKHYKICQQKNNDYLQNTVAPDGFLLESRITRIAKVQIQLSLNGVNDAGNLQSISLMNHVMLVEC